MPQRLLIDDDCLGATFSDCRRYRYALWRTWGDGPLLGFIALNPSTADETINDATTRRCIDFARRTKHAGLVMLNLFAWRDVSPAAMMRVKDPIGRENDEHLQRWAHQCHRLVAAWGVPGTFMARDQAVCKLLGQELWCLGRTKGGLPRHPLYIAKATPLQIFWQPSA